MKLPSEIWVADAEYHQPDNHLPKPVCMVFHEINSGRTKEVWLWDSPMATPPFDVEDSLYITFSAVAEMLVHHVLGWPLPRNLIDLHSEFHWYVAGRKVGFQLEGYSLLEALRYFGLGHTFSVEKEYWRELAMRGGPYTAEEQRGLLDYCREDVLTTAALFKKMLPFLDVPRALKRGRFGVCAAKVPYYGIPVDVPSLETINSQRESIRSQLIQKVDSNYKVFDGDSLVRKSFLRWTEKNGIFWPITQCGDPALDEETLEEMSVYHPVVKPLAQLLKTLNELKKVNLPVGTDGRCHVSPGLFGTVTGRNSPRARNFVFLLSKWWRYLIKAAPGTKLIYLDWRSQEFAIAADLSGDVAMKRAYQSGDVYLGFAKACGAAPESATKDTHPELRDRFKAVTLAIQYGKGAEALGRDLGGGVVAGQRILDLHKAAFPRFWEWSEEQCEKALTGGVLKTPFGWQMIGDALALKPRTFKNFQIQGTGADMMRVAVILMIEAGIHVLAMVHDGFLIEAPIDGCSEVAKKASALMEEASRLTLNGFTVDVDGKEYPDRFRDKVGAKMWRDICSYTGIVD